jgi:hypothetical protein
MRIITVEGHTFDYDEIWDVEAADDLADKTLYPPGSIILFRNDGPDIVLTEHNFVDIRELADATPRTFLQ